MKEKKGSGLHGKIATKGTNQMDIFLWWSILHVEGT